MPQDLWVAHVERSCEEAEGDLFEISIQTGLTGSIDCAAQPIYSMVAPVADERDSPMLAQATRDVYGPIIKSMFSGRQICRRSVVLAVAWKH